MIRFEHVTKQYAHQPRPALDDVSFEVPPGSTCAILGSSGSGKTTLLRCVNRLCDDFAGGVRFDGRDVRSLPVGELRRGIGMVFQHGALFPHRTVADNIATVPRLLGWPRARIRERIGELLQLVGLDAAHFAGRYPRQLSGGERQRVGVARALAADPPVLLLDEPFGALDGLTRERMQDEVQRLKETLRKTMLLVTHDLFEALRLGDSIAVLHEGRLEQAGPPAELRERPATPFVRELFETPARLLGRL
jgi:osmoprotectant transport system ATP-binding protein